MSSERRVLPLLNGAAPSAVARLAVTLACCTVVSWLTAGCTAPQKPHLGEASVTATSASASGADDQIAQRHALWSAAMSEEASLMVALGAPDALAHGVLAHTVTIEVTPEARAGLLQGWGPSRTPGASPPPREALVDRFVLASSTAAVLDPSLLGLGLPARSVSPDELGKGLFLNDRAEHRVHAAQGRSALTWQPV